MRKILITICTIASIAHLSASGAEKLRLPSLAKLEQISDSILDEGLRLYLYEHLAWVSSDSLMKHCPLAQEVNGSGIYVDSTMVMRYFYSRNDDVLFTYNFDTTRGEEWWDATPHKMTQEEQDAKKERRECIDLALKTYGDSIYNNSDAKGKLNAEVIWVSPDLIRVYFLQGTTLNVVPFGNDYSVDINRNKDVVGFRHYHHSYIPLPIDVDGERVKALFHSHTSDNPYITATDICNSLLYARDFFGMSTHSILSTAFEKRILQIFDMQNITLQFVDYDEFLKTKETQQ